jgi:hypothetical protein
MDVEKDKGGMKIKKELFVDLGKENEGKVMENEIR